MGRQNWKPGNMLYPLPEAGRETEHHHAGMDGNDLQFARDGVDLGAPGAVLV